MLNENIKAVRKSKGFSQEELAIKLNVVRQTISKWEKGHSVPDAEMITKIADVFEVPVSQLLGEKIEVEKEPNILAEQLALINEQLAEKNRQWNRLREVLGAVLLLVLVLLLLGSVWDGWTDMWYEFGEHIYRWFH